MTNELDSTKTIPLLVDPDRYAAILPIEDGFFQHFPGIYCRNCGRDFALYSYSAYQPDGIDDNQKPYYNRCSHCPEPVKINPNQQYATNAEKKN